MIKTVFAIALATVAVVGVSAPSHAAPAAPLAAGITSNHANLTPVYWRRGYYGPRRYYAPRGFCYYHPYRCR